MLFGRHIRLFFDLLLVSGFIVSTPAKAQFYNVGADPGVLKWRQIVTDGYQVIYPAGDDSLARTFAVELEKWRKPVSRGIGFTPNQFYCKPMPVVLHTKAAYSNGLVTWTPHRMELVCTPDAYNPESNLWTSLLAVHESRHVAQLQYTRKGFFKALHYITGELGDGAAAALYCGPAWFEGDAVATETALSNAGRGRTADFLEYVRVSQSDGSRRDFWQWRYGSQKRFAPDHYRAGYMLHAGVRTVFDAPDFSERYYRRMFDRFAPIGNLQGTVKDISGKSFRKAFRDIEDAFQSEWDACRAQRAPYFEGKQVTGLPERYTSFTGLTTDGEDLFAIRKGIADPTTLVSVSADGKQKRIQAFSDATSRLAFDGGRIWWSEYTPDNRWEMKSTSELKYRTRRGPVQTFVAGERLYNPAPNGDKVAAVEYPLGGGCAVALFSVPDGKRIGTFTAPAHLTINEAVWIGDELYASATSPEGFGIYRTGGWECVYAPLQCKINHLFSRGALLYFTSDRNGVNELYSLNPADGTLLQLTSTPDGASDFVFKGDSLYFSRPLADGKMIFSIAEADLSPRTPGEVYRSPIAEKLSAQMVSTAPDHVDAAAVGEPVKYSKAGHLFRLHSWLPAYFNYDAIKDLSGESVSQAAGLGASLYFQNTLGTMTAFFGYSAWNPSSGWRNSGHAKISWRGWYPVFEAAVDFNDRNRLDYFAKEGKVESAPAANPLFNASLKMYLPCNTSSNGWNGGFIPSVQLALTNDSFLYPNGKRKPLSQYVVSVRGYKLRPIAASGIYPRFGIGAELAYQGSLVASDVQKPIATAQLYGYLPGLWKTHGLRLSATASYIFKADSALSYDITADYAFPFLALDWSALCPVAYFKNLEGIAHFELSSLGNFIGGSVSARLANLLWIPYDTRIGVKYLHALSGPTAGVGSASLVFGIDF